MKTIYTEPWKHLLIDDFISMEEQKTLSDFIQPYYSEVLATQKSVRLHVSRENNKIIGPIFYPKLQELMDNHFEELNFGDKILPEKYYLATCINIVIPGFQYNQIHEESPNKILTAVMYAHNETGSGTRIYTGPTQDSYYGDIEWKRNRVLCFVGQRSDNHQKTWHDFGNDTTTPRVTVNMRALIKDQFG